MPERLDRIQARVEAIASILVGLRDHFPTIGKRVDGTLLNAADLDEHDFKWLLAVGEAVALPLEDDGAAFARAIALDSNFKASGFVLEDSPPATRTVSDCIESRAEELMYNLASWQKSISEIHSQGDLRFAMKLIYRLTYLYFFLTPEEKFTFFRTVIPGLESDNIQLLFPMAGDEDQIAWIEDFKAQRHDFDNLAKRAIPIFDRMVSMNPV